MSVELGTRAVRLQGRLDRMIEEAETRNRTRLTMPGLAKGQTFGR